MTDSGCHLTAEASLAVLLASRPPWSASLELGTTRHRKPGRLESDGRVGVTVVSFGVVVSRCAEASGVRADVQALRNALQQVTSRAKDLSVHQSRDEDKISRFGGRAQYGDP